MASGRPPAASPGPSSSVPEILGGQTRNATVVGLSPWVEYEFRVVAGNGVGVGEPSAPSGLLRTNAAGERAAAPRRRGGSGARFSQVRFPLRA